MPQFSPRPVLCFLLLCSPAAAGADQAATLSEALRASRPVLELRYRYEDVADDAAGDQHAHASTLRTVVGLETGSWKGLSLYIEAEDVSVVGNELYNNAGAAGSGNGVGDRPVVADPEGTAVHQALVRWQGESLGVRVGRQEIVLGDARFVGNVGWRQHHQSFDALRLEGTGLGRLGFTYLYIDRVERINRAADNMASHVGNLRLDLGRWGDLTLYALLLDYEDPARATLSSATWGAELAGDWQLAAGRSIRWELESALQRDHADNPRHLDAQYFFASLGYRSEPITVRLGWERLGGSARDGQFSTPLATLHGFNGWADKFLATPVDGLEDLHLELGGSFKAFRWTLRYHDFGAATGGGDYGSEVDTQLLYQTPWKQTFGLKGAFYNADELAADTQKWMFWTSYRL